MIKYLFDHIEYVSFDTIKKGSATFVLNKQKAIENKWHFKNNEPNIYKYIEMSTGFRFDWDEEYRIIISKMCRHINYRFQYFDEWFIYQMENNDSFGLKEVAVYNYKRQSFCELSTIPENCLMNLYDAYLITLKYLKI